MGKNIRTIPATISRYTLAPLTEQKKRRVAAYARVSTNREEQETSYEAQVSYYTNYIAEHVDWEFVNVYSDEGISGCNTKSRNGFKTMIKDALDGKIDLIVTKSISRFARNTVDSLTTIRQLKEKGVELYFEKENIWTFDGKGELLITIMSSLAQEESRSISENITWGTKKRAADGKITVAYSRLLGYDRGPDGNLVINPQEAVIVKLIYKLYLEGYASGRIARILTENGIPKTTGKGIWYNSTIDYILTNEKYKGDALLQKLITTDFLTKKRKINEGELPQYYVTGNHEPIIDPKVFDQVQEEFKRRKKLGSYRCSDIYVAKIKCGKCGNWFSRVVWHSNDKYRCIVYRCMHRYRGGETCHMPRITEKEIKELFVKAVNQYLGNKKELLANANKILSIVGDTAELELQSKQLAVELDVLKERIERLIAENATRSINQDAYAQDYRTLTATFEAKKAEKEQIESTISDKKARESEIQKFIETLTKTGEFITEFDVGIWSEMIAYVTVYGKNDVRITFKDGVEI